MPDDLSPGQLNRLSKVAALRRSADECADNGDVKGSFQLRAIAAEHEAEVYREALAGVEGADEDAVNIAGFEDSEPRFLSPLQPRSTRSVDLRRP